MPTRAKAEFLVLGAHGQLGQAFLRALGPRAVGWGREQFDFASPAAWERGLTALRPAVVINTAAFNYVDLAETRRQVALDANFSGPAHLARLSVAQGWRLVHFSTDYVFGGDGLERPRLESDAPAPVNFYGYSKLLGEEAVLRASSTALVARVAHLYGGSPLGGSLERPRAERASPAGHRSPPSSDQRERPSEKWRATSPGRMNLVQRFVAQARGGEPITVTRGQYLNPTSVQDIVPAILSLLDQSAAGLFHLTGEGACTAREFATAVLELAGLPIRIRELDRDPRPTVRPRYTVLENRRLAEAGLPPLPPWRVSLAHYVSRLTGRELG